MHQWKFDTGDAYSQTSRNISTCTRCGIGRQFVEVRRTVYFVTAQYRGDQFNLTEQEPPCAPIP